MTPSALPSRFDPGPIETRWQTYWEEQRLFQAPERPTHPTFVLPQPPPNVTGFLTLGHGLGDTVRDVLARWHRMRGFDVLWFPGIDHAGLATQIEVRRQFAKQGVRLESLSREEIIARVEEWRLEHERRIQGQTHAGGFSVDWSRYRYTMDAGFVRATREAFVRLYEAGLVYRGERFVNWDPELKTAISDLEVVRTNEAGQLLYVRYPWVDGSPGGIVIATVRPETIFGDIAVAVHPADARHAAVVGRKVRVPLTDRVIPIVADEQIDSEFGNGALKLTPRHDLLDYRIFTGHPELSMPPTILDLEGHLTGDWVPHSLQGLDRETARSRVTEMLQADGLLERIETIQHSVARSERSDAVVEPMLSTQWFVKMQPLAAPVLEAVRTGKITIHPERWNLTFFRWMEGLEDWCISRQIAWGHPIPVYYCSKCQHEMAKIDPPLVCENCGARDLRPDPDVLDTWFSSWLWPFAALGWPESTADLGAYYPASVLVTGRDIMFFWVARMMMAGFYFTGKPPFSDVYFTGMLRDERGRRMSKHLGNSPDPAELIREWGADALRFALLYPNPVDQDSSFSAATLEQARNFLTKLWNVARFGLGHLPEGTPPPRSPPELGSEAPLEDRWILSRWRRMTEELEAALRRFEPTTAATLLWGFLWHDLADRYVEIAKEALAGRRGNVAQRRARAILLFVLERSLRELHPMVPHVSEELWHALPHEGESLATAPWPDGKEAPADPQAEVEMEIVLEAVRVFRNLKAENRIPVQTPPSSWVIPSGGMERELLKAEGATIQRIARLASLEVLELAAARPPGAASAVGPAGEFFVALPKGTAEQENLVREQAKLRALLEKTQARLQDVQFREHAPSEVVHETEAKANELAERLRRIGDHLGTTAPESVS